VKRKDRNWNEAGGERANLVAYLNPVSGLGDIRILVGPDGKRRIRRGEAGGEMVDLVEYLFRHHRFHRSCM
jgi:hypothetical protein